MVILAESVGAERNNQGKSSHLQPFRIPFPRGQMNRETKELRDRGKKSGESCWGERKQGYSCVGIVSFC